MPRTLACLKRFDFSSKNHSPVTVLSCLHREKRENIETQLFSQIENSQKFLSKKNRQLFIEFISISGVLYDDYYGQY